MTMRAMILAAGRGERCRPLTDRIPKCLLPIGNIPLIEFHLQKLANAGVDTVVINVAYYADLIMDTLGSGKQFNLNILYSIETPTALETGGGILKALPLLGEMPFICISADIFSTYNYDKLCHKNNSDIATHLVLTAPKPSTCHADFILQKDRVLSSPAANLTYAGFSILSPTLFYKHTVGDNFPLRNILATAIKHQSVSGEYFSGDWFNIGTPQCYEQACHAFNTNPHKFK